MAIMQLKIITLVEINEIRTRLSTSARVESRHSHSVTASYAERNRIGYIMAISAVSHRSGWCIPALS